MTKLSTLAKTLVLVLGLVFVTSTGAQAQQVTLDASTSSFDAYRAVAVTAGVIGGAVVATIVTDGLILPAYGALTWSSIGPIANGGFAMIYQPGYAFFRGSMRLLGAVSGGLYADSWYADQ